MGQIDVRLPLALLSAMQEQDTPPELLPDEDPEASFPQRLGLSGVVDRQIREFRRLARRGGRVDLPQVEALVRLVARRADAETIFEAAGAELARIATEGAAGRLRRTARFLPESLRYRAAARALRSVSGEIVIAGETSVGSAPFELRLTDGLTIRADPEGVACRLYAALTREVVERHGVRGVAIAHVHCQARSDERCVWRSVAADDATAGDAVSGDGAERAAADPDPEPGAARTEPAAGGGQ